MDILHAEFHRDDFLESAQLFEECNVSDEAGFYIEVQIKDLMRCMIPIKKIQIKSLVAEGCDAIFKRRVSKGKLS